MVGIGVRDHFRGGEVSAVGHSAGGVTNLGTVDIWGWITILKEISPGCSLEGLMLKLKLQYFGHLMRRVDSLEKTLKLGGTGGQ